MKKNKGNILIIILFSLIVMIPLLTDPYTLGHDTEFHIANIEDLKLEIGEAFLPHRISSNIGYNLGYGTHLFYPMLPHLIGAYIAKITSLWHLSTANAVVLTYTIITILSAIVIYFLEKKIAKENIIALLSAIIFLFMPYRLGDIVVRQAYNEAFIFLFAPLVLLGLFYFVEKKDHYFYLWFIIGCTGMLYSHQVLTLYYAMFLIPFVFLFRKQFFPPERRKVLGKAIIVILLLSLPGIVPMLEHKFSGEYMIFQKDFMSSLGYMEAFSNKLSDYFIIRKDYTWDNIPMYVNFLVILLLAVSFYFYKRKKKKDKNETYLWILTAVSFVITLNIFPWVILPNFLYLIQFPWRNVTFLTITISLLAPLGIKIIKEEKRRTIVAVLLLLLIPCTEIPLLKKLSNQTYQWTTIDFEKGMGHSKEYLPKRAYDNITYFETRTQEVKDLSGTATIIEKERQKEEITIEIETSSEEVTVEFPRLYYLGYQLKAKDGHVVALEESPNGFIQARVQGSGTYTLVYQKTILERGVDLLVIPGIGYFLFLLSGKKRTKKKKKTT